MKCAMMQPSFMPWPGLFELIYMSEVFIFLDDFQFSVQSYHQRNRLFINTGKAAWYTVPVKKSVSFKAPLNKTLINEDVQWRDKSWKRIEHNYSHAPYYKKFAPCIKSWLEFRAPSLGEQNIAFIKFVCNALGLDREFRLSSQHKTAHSGSRRVLEFLRSCRADIYYSAKGSFQYMLEEKEFPVKDIEILFQDFVPVPYLQVGSTDGFVPFLSVLDALFNIGPEKTMDIVKTGTKKWLRWEDMVAASSPEYLNKVSHENKAR